MKIKRFLPFLLLSLLAAVSLIYVFAQERIDLSDAVYEIVDDVGVYTIPKTGNQYRFANGKWYVKYSNLAGWGELQEPVYLIDLLNGLDIATTADVAAAGASTAGLTEYFGATLSWPYSFNYWTTDGTGPTMSNPQGGAIQLFRLMLSAIQRNLLAINGYYLDNTGTVRSITTNMDVAEITAEGFAGLGRFVIPNLGRLLTGLNVQETPGSYNALSETGGVTSLTSPYLQGLNSGMVGLASLLRNNTSVLSSFSSANHQDFNNNFSRKYSNSIYYPGRSGVDDITADFNIADTMSAYMSVMNRSLVTQLPYLNAVGVTQNAQGYIVGVADVLAYGIQGLSYNLIGDQQEDGYEYLSLDYKDLENPKSVYYKSILPLLAQSQSDIQNLLATYLFSHGTDMDVEIRDNMTEQAEQFIDDFTSPDGKGTPSTSEIGDVANVSGGIDDLGENDASIADVFSQLGDDDNYSFFSSSTQQELNPMYSQRSLADNDDGYVDFLDSHVREYFSKVGSQW